MKQLNIDTFKQWVMESFDLNKVVKDCEEKPGYDWSWEGLGEFDFLSYGPELIATLEIYNFASTTGLLIHSREIEAMGGQVITIKNPYGFCDWSLLKFVPENADIIQAQVEEELEQKAKVNLIDWLND